MWQVGSRRSCCSTGELSIRTPWRLAIVLVSAPTYDRTDSSAAFRRRARLAQSIWVAWPAGVPMRPERRRSWPNGSALSRSLQLRGSQ